MKHIVIIATVMAFGVFTMPPTAQAFPKETVDRSAIASTDAGVGAYQISFTIGATREAVRIPVIGQRNLENGARTDRFGYEFIAERDPIDGVATNGTSTALILSSAPIVDGMYEIAPGKQYRMMALAVFSVLPEEGNEYRFRLIELPFYQGADRTPQHFTPSELKYFFTEAQDLHYDWDALNGIE